MGQVAFERAVQGRLMGRPHLIPVFTDPLRIPERLREWNPAYYVVLNVIRVLEKIQGLHYKEWTPIPPGVTPRYNAWYEVHKLTTPLWLEEGVILPFGALDVRTIPYVVERDIELSGLVVFKRMQEHNRQHEETLARRRLTLANDIARDLRTAAALDHWGQSHFGPGRLSH